MKMFVINNGNLQTSSPLSLNDQQELKMFELSSNGTEYISIKASVALASTYK